MDINTVKTVTVISITWLLTQSHHFGNTLPYLYLMFFISTNPTLFPSNNFKYGTLLRHAFSGIRPLNEPTFHMIFNQPN